ncbi:hypothetical protein BKA62DRAFT_107782 [Auriculariales sp. MPI-PUGE-AT-0066]|nr:hypothetical protein BKA62DRAFT_107782 [Auriculariales sp. MPI-PUGE-AT-0066]
MSLELDAQKRRAVLEADAHSGAVRPFSIFCKTCEEDIDIDNATPYHMAAWTKHCRSVHGRNAEEADELYERALENFAPLTVPFDGFGPQMRQHIISRDPLVSEITLEGALCSDCNQWIDLAGEFYALDVWMGHVDTVHARPLRESVQARDAALASFSATDNDFTQPQSSNQRTRAAENAPSPLTPLSGDDNEPTLSSDPPLISQSSTDQISDTPAPPA